MQINEILEVALGVLLAFFTLRVWDFITTIQKRREANRRHAEFLNSVRGMAKEVIDELEKGIPNAKQRSQTAKSTGKRSKATARVAKKKVSGTKKGV